MKEKIKRYFEKFNPDIEDSTVTLSERPNCCFKACHEKAVWDVEMQDGSTDGIHNTAGLWGYVCDKHFLATKPVIGSKLTFSTL